MNKLIGSFITLLILLSPQLKYAQQPQKELLYVGTTGKEGLYVLEFNRSKRTFNKIQTANKAGGSQAIHPDGHFLYSTSGERVSPDENQGSVAAYQIDQTTGKLTLINIQSAEGRGPAHISVDPKGRFVYVSNYASGSLSVYSILDNGSLTKAVDVVQHEGSSVNKKRQSKPHVHSIIPSSDGKFIYVSDLGIDKIMIYAVDPETGKISPAKTSFAKIEPGSGPRHFTFHPNSTFAYSVNELSNTITVFAVNKNTGSLRQIQEVNTLPEDFKGTSYSADIHISPDGEHLYATNRGHDSVAIYSINSSTGQLTSQGYEPTRGGDPWSFAIDKFGKFIFMSNMEGDNIVLFERNPETSLLTYTGVEVEIQEPICVTQHVL